MSNNDSNFASRQHQPQQQQHQSPEFAVNYTFGEQSSIAQQQQPHPYGLSPILQSITTGHPTIHSEALFSATPDLHGLSSCDNAHLLGHHNQMSSSTTDLSNYSNKLLDVPGVAPPQYTSVIVEPPQNYQMDEYVH